MAKQKRVMHCLLTGVCWLLPGLFQPAWGQTAPSTLFLNESVTFEHYSLGQGLSNKDISAIHQDKEGFLWIGTPDGLNRFDGYRFTAYQTDSTDKMPYTSVEGNIHEDRAGRLWLATLNKGLCQFDKRTGKFTSYRIDSVGQHERNSCFDLFADRQGSFWLPSPGGLSKFDPRTHLFTLYPNPTLGEFMYVVHQDAAGGFWVGTSRGLFQFDPRTAKFTLFALSTNEEDKATGILNIYQDRKGILWIGAIRTGLFRLNPATRQFTRYPYQKNGLTGSRIFNAIVEDAAGMIWIGTDNGLQRLDPKTGQFTTYQANASIPGSLKSNEIHSLLIDKSGLLWIGTPQGLHRLVPHSKQIQTYQFRPDASYSRRPENTVGLLYKDHSGILWLRNESPGGLYRYDRRNGQLTHYAAGPTDPRRLLSDEVRAVCEDGAGVLWVLAGKCLHALDRKTGRFTRYPMPIYCWLMGEDPAGQLWIAGEALARFDRNSGQFTYYRHDPSDTNTLGYGPIYPLLTSRSGAIWLGMFGRGLSRMDPQTGRFTHYRLNFSHPAGHLNSRIILSLYEDEAGILWIGTAYGGLNRLDPKTGLFTAYTTRDGLPSNRITSVVGDRSGHLWLSSYQGLSRFNPRTKTCRNYDQRDGLQDNEFNDAVGTRSPTGELLFGGPNGFNVFHPDSLRDNPQVPPVRLTAFTVLNKPRLLPIDQVELSYQENFLSFEFAALNYVRPEKNQYAYQLMGVDQKWVYSGSRRFASYTNLDPGEYVFKVKGSNNDGVWNEKGATLHLLIHPPWWRTWWAYGLYALAFVGSVWGFIYYRSRQLIREKRVLEQKVATRTAEVVRQKEEILEINEELNQQKEEIAAQRDQVSQTLSELQATQSQLIQKEKMASLGELTAGIAHEIQNPLNFVNNFSEVSTELVEELKQEIAADHKDDALIIAEDLAQNLSKIHHHGQRADGIVKNMLQHSRASTGEKQITDLNTLANEFLLLSYHGMRAKDKDFNAALLTEFDPGLAKIAVVPQELGRVLLNLFNNAFYATQQKEKLVLSTTNATAYRPEVKVSTFNLGDKVEIRVRDNGTGIPLKVVDKIFQPFFTTKPTGQGTGLGLSLSYDIITKGHGGELKAETRPGEYAEFIITLPG